MHLSPYLNFEGKCEEAFKFYEKCFNGKITALVTFDSMGPGQVPEGWGGKIMHAQMTVNGLEVMGSDGTPDRFEKTQGFAMSVHVDTPAEADRMFNALAENGAVQLPIQKTAWSERFGMLTDRFGIPWMVNCAASGAATA